MMRSSLGRVARCAMGATALTAVLGLSGCAFNPVATFTTPTLAQFEQETVRAAVSDEALVSAGTLTVALDESDAPQAMQASDGTLTGYAVDTARALAARMGLKVSFVSATSADSALGGSKADIFIGDISKAGSDITNLGTCLYDAPAVFGRADDGQAQSVSVDKLNSSTLGVQTSSASQEALAKAGITANQKTYSNINECFDALASGEVDYVVCDSTAGGYLSRLDDRIAFVATLETPSTLGVACASSNSTLSKAVSEALSNITADGTLEAVHSIWYGTMPFNLASEPVTGANVEAASAAEATTSTSSSSSSTQEPTITDDDINKLAD